MMELDYEQCPECGDMLYPMAAMLCGHKLCDRCAHSTLFCPTCYWQRDLTTTSGFVIPTDMMMNAFNQVDEWCPCCDWYNGCFEDICNAKVRT